MSRKVYRTWGFTLQRWVTCDWQIINAELDKNQDMTCASKVCCDELQHNQQIAANTLTSDAQPIWHRGGGGGTQMSFCPCAKETGKEILNQKTWLNLSCRFVTLLVYSLDSGNCAQSLLTSNAQTIWHRGGGGQIRFLFMQQRDGKIQFWIRNYGWNWSLIRCSGPHDLMWVFHLAADMTKTRLSCAHTPNKTLSLETR